MHGKTQGVKRNSAEISTLQLLGKMEIFCGKSFEKSLS
jgi:hypothetical protein